MEDRPLRDGGQVGGASRIPHLRSKAYSTNGARMATFDLGNGGDAPRRRRRDDDPDKNAQARRNALAKLPQLNVAINAAKADMAKHDGKNPSRWNAARALHDRLVAERTAIIRKWH